MPLFEVAILEHPTKKDAEEQGAVEKLVLGPKAVVAKNRESAAIAAVLEVKDLQVNVQRSEVIVRPFA